MDGAVARAKLYVEAGADAIFPEALNNAEMFRAFAKAMPGVPLLANMTEFGKTPFFTAAEFEAMGYKMVIWPVSRCASPTRRRRSSIAAIEARRRHPQHARPRCRPGPSSTRRSAYHEYEALDASIVETIVQGMPQR